MHDPLLNLTKKFAWAAKTTWNYANRAGICVITGAKSELCPTMWFVGINVLYRIGDRANLHFSRCVLDIKRRIHIVSYKVYIYIYIYTYVCTYILWCICTLYCTCFYSRLRARNTSVVTNIHVTSTIKMNIFQIFAIGAYTHTPLECFPLARSILIFPSFLILHKNALWKICELRPWKRTNGQK